MQYAQWPFSMQALNITANKCTSNKHRVAWAEHRIQKNHLKTEETEQMK